MINNINKNDYIEFLKSRNESDILLIKKELYNDINKLKKDNRRFRYYSFILKNKFLKRLFGKNASKKIIQINPNSEAKLNQKNMLYELVNTYLKNQNGK